MSYRGRPYRGFERGGRGRGGGSWRGPRPNRVEQPPSNLPLGPTIDNININTLFTEEDSPTITDTKYVASYNWLDGKSPVVLVPGSPPAWTPPATDSKLSLDSEDVYRDINAARYPRYPMETSIRALQAMRPNYDMQEVDVVGCGSTLGNLLRFASKQNGAFRFDVDVVGDVVFFIRRERSPTEIIPDLHGYGHTFPEAYTTWDSEVSSSCSHQRIIEYEFGGLKFLVRTETDGYLKDAKVTGSLSTSSTAKDPSLDSLLEAVTMTSAKFSHGGNLELKIQGREVPQSQIFDIKTRASYKPYDMNEILPRLWMNQTSKFLIAYHDHGLFDKPEVKDIRQEVLQWEKDNAGLLGRFHALVKRIVDVVRDSDQEQLEVSWDGQGHLYVTEQIGEKRRALPLDLLRDIEDAS